MVANSGNKKFTQHLFKHLPEIAGNTVIITTILLILQIYLLKAPVDGAFANGILIALLLTLN